MTLVSILLLLLPAAVALTLPLPGWFAMRRARSEGVEFRDLGALRSAGGVDTVVLDRWGTVTTGELVVSHVESLEDEDDDRNLRWFAAALEHADEGPVAQAIARMAPPGHLARVKSYPGRGIGGAVDRHPVRVGTPSWLGMEERHGLGEIVAVEVDHRPFGYLTVTDQVRPGAAEAVASLKDGGIDPILLSDAPALDTEHLAQTCGIGKWLVGVGADERQQLVRDQRGEGHCVAVVARAAGNESVLRAGDVSFADGAIGPDSPDVLMVDLDVHRLAAALELVRRIPTIALRTRITGVLLSVVGGVLAALGHLAGLTALGGAVVGCLAVVLAAAWSVGLPTVEDDEHSV